MGKLDDVNRKREDEALRKAVHHIDEAKKNMDFVSPGHEIFKVDSARESLRQAKDTLIKEVKRRGLL